MAPYRLRFNSSGVAIWAFLACSAGSGDAAVFSSSATDVRLPEMDLSFADSWNTEGLEAEICLLQMHFRHLQQVGAQRLAVDGGQGMSKEAQDAKRFDRIRAFVGIPVFCVVFTLASLAAVRSSSRGAAKGKHGKEVAEGSSRQEPTAEASPEGEQGAEFNDLPVRFDFVSRLLEDKRDTREINVSGLNSNLLYGLYMQATCGDVRGRRPWVLRPKDRAKWDSWASQQGQPTTDAMARYIEVACNAMQDLEETACSIGAESCAENEHSGDLRSRFDTAAGDLEEKMRKGDVDAPTADMVAAYGLYKQATCGDIQSAQPWVYNIKARAKWDSWAALKGMAPSEAMETYIAVVKRLLASQ